MSEIKFYGASDDLIEVEGQVEDEFDNPKGTWHGVVAGPVYGAVGVWLRYTKHGTWAVGVYPLDEDQSLPDWPITIRQGTEVESSYSAVLIIDAPDGSSVATPEDGKP